jgi:TrmH family RNA methyltransferase
MTGRRMHDSDPRAALIRQVFSRVRSLQQRRTVRDSTHQFWIEGIRQFTRAFETHHDFDTIVHSRTLLKSSVARLYIRQLTERGVRRIAVTPEQFRAIHTAEHASGIGAIVRQRWTLLSNVVTDAKRPCWLVIEQLCSPGNLGTILRTAEATGAAGVIFLGSACDPFDPSVVRASMGGMFSLQLARATHAELARWAVRAGVQVIGLSAEAARLWTDLPDASSLAFVIGEERQGLSPAARAMCSTFVRLPMSGTADSLNVGVAAGVMMYEVVRRGNHIPPPLSPR